MNALTNEELDNIREITGIKNLNGHVFNLTPGQSTAFELIDVYIANYVIRNSGYKENPKRLDRIIRIIKKLSDEGKDGSEPIMLEKQIDILPIKFNGPGKEGDFEWMIKQPQYNKSLFIFNDNQEQFQAFTNFRLHGTRDPLACSKGGGNAVIRPYQCDKKAKAAGIPTGLINGQGYQSLGNKSDINPPITQIDKAVYYIEELLKTGEYSQIIYSSDENGYLGSGIFNVSNEVKKYITESLFEMVERVNSL